MSEQAWTFLTNHGLVLVALARQPDLRIREVASIVGITERAVHDIVNDLVDAGYLERSKEGRRNTYVVHGELAMRHGLTERHQVADLIGAVVSEVQAGPSAKRIEAVVLACSDFRFQEPLRKFLSMQGLDGASEVILWPGGAAALAGPQRAQVLNGLAAVVEALEPERVLLISHQGCVAEGIFRRARAGTGVRTYRALIRARREATQRVHERLGMFPESWFMDERRTRRIRVLPTDDPYPHHPG